MLGDTVKRTYFHVSENAAKDEQTESSHEKTSKTPKWRNILNWPIVFEECENHESQGKTEEMF